jgi:hypothetical protein
VAGYGRDFEKKDTGISVYPVAIVDTGRWENGYSVYVIGLACQVRKLIIVYK